MAKSSKQNLIKFGENLKKLREAKGLSQRSLATLCNIDHSTIAKIERGERNITVLTVIDLSQGLDIKPKRLFDYD